MRIAPHFRTTLGSELAMTEMAQPCPATILGLIEREKAIENPSHERAAVTPCFVAVTLAGLLASGKPAKDARAYLYIGPSTRISPVATAPGDRPHASTEITIGPIATFARETPEEVVRAPCVERRPPPQ
ncbi:hypothetical protein [Methylorubrum extorquens]|uniref:hypothetical protein n=1 Tax=Methylorubrum extorquens TaxID=408 RepID=UPI002238462B|nr:hypothetical protein [Methylorubrum extorquens]UYW35272.1 hypothetical protein OKB92_05210 [Methylorubrum extorquens]